MPGGVKNANSKQFTMPRLPVVEFCFCFSSVLLHPTSASASDCRYLFVFPAVVRGMQKGRRYTAYYKEYIIVIDFSVQNLMYVAFEYMFSTDYTICF